MTLTVIVEIAVVGVAIGIAVGAVGIGGVLLVPILNMVLGIDVKHAIAASLLSYLPGAGVAVVLYARRGSVPWRETWMLCLAALPAAYLGARVAGRAPASLLEVAIGALLLAGGLYALCVRPKITTARVVLAPVTLFGLGGGTGFLSGMTGAGGAFVLLPVLLLLDTPVLPAIGMGMAIALPIAGMASVANFAAGLIDFRLGAGLAVTLSLGVAIGTPIAHALPQQRLRSVLGIVVVLAGVAMLLRTTVRIFAGAG